MGWIFVVCWKYGFLDISFFRHQTSSWVRWYVSCLFDVCWMRWLVGDLQFGWGSAFRVSWTLVGTCNCFFTSTMGNFDLLYSPYVMLSGSGCVVSALQRCRCRLCRSCICDQIYQQDLNHVMSCFESSHVFLMHASWSLQGTPDVRRYGPRWLTYV